MEEGGGIMAAQDGSSTAQRDENLLKSKHSIFLSHSGAQKNFVEQLCVDIERHDRYPFFDKRRDSLSIGCNFPKLIFKAIQQCRVAVVVLSEEFFTRSKWPMLELAALVKRKTHDPKLIIMPVFLCMTHAQCRAKENQDRWLSEWQGWAKVDSRINPEEWHAALKIFGFTNGISLIDGLDEVMCRGEIVEAICKEVPPKTKWDDSHVYGRSRMSAIIHLKIDGLQVSRSYGARILGLYGMGGIGKTTICKVLCNDYFEEFEGRVCHIEFGVGNKLLMLQEILKRLTKTNPKLIKSLSEDECKNRLQNDLKKKVFLAIDNISDTQQIVDEAKDLIRMGFVRGSIVVVTARSLPQLWNLNLEDCMPMPELEEDDARSLFLYHAAPGSYLKNAKRMNDGMNEQLIKQCTNRCYFGKGDGINYQYHPLALKVLGGQLGNDPKEWSEKLNELDPFNQYQEEEKVHPVFSILERSFETLKHEDQFLFMDAAIFFPQELKDELTFQNAVNIFEWLSMVHGKSLYAIKRRLEGLRNKSLLENLGDGNEVIGMHDLWRGFSAMKAKGGECSSQPWIFEKVFDLYDRRREESSLSGGGWESLQRICMAGDHGKESFVKEINLSCCSNLRVLKLAYVDLETQVLDVSSLQKLKSLEIVQTMPSSSSNLDIRGLGCLRNLLYLNLHGIQTETAPLHEEIGGLTNLQVLHVRHPRSLSRPAFSRSNLFREVISFFKKRDMLPDFSRLNSLKDVVFSCKKAEIVSGLSSKMTNIRRLSLQGCDVLRSCHGVSDLVVLEELDLSFCIRLEELPNVGRMKNLLEYDVSFTYLIKAVPGLGNLVSLQIFQATGCFKLVELPDVRKLVNLQKLDLNSCPLIKAIPGLSNLFALEEIAVGYGQLEGCYDLRELTKLETFTIEGWSAQGLPCLSDLVNLKNLQTSHAKGVAKWTSPYNMTSLQVLTIENCSFQDLHCLSNFTAITNLDVSRCDQLESLPDMRKLTRLEVLEVMFCGSLKEWKGGSELRQFGADLHSVWTLPQLQDLTLRSVALTEIPDLSCFPRLRELYIMDCEELMSLSSSAPLTALENVSLYGCRSLRTLPDLNHLVSLRTLEMWGCREVQLTALEIEQLEEMCPALELDIEGHQPDMESETEDESDVKRLKS